jgi:orotate phosphoribosyltransferase
VEKYKEQFIEFMLESGVLTFGDFITKSGRKTPFFINTGNYKTGDQLVRLGEFYAEAIMHNLSSFDVLFGPAYKGIPLAVSTAMIISMKHGKNISFCFNRKEAKDHGEGGTLIGHKLKEGNKVVIIEDVTTAGTSIRESIPLLQSAAKVIISGLVVSVDRMEKGTGTKSALAELRDEFGIKTFSIVTLAEIVEHLSNKEFNGKLIIDNAMLKRIEEYRAVYGATD